MKKLLALILGGTLMLSALTGCASTSSSTSTDSTSTSTASSSSSASTESDDQWPAVTLQYLNINSESMGSAGVQAMVDEFNATNGKNITVEFNYVSSNYVEIASEVQSLLAAGQDVGVVQVGYAYINYFAENFPQLQDIESVITNYAPQDADYLATIYEDSVKELGRALNGDLAGAAYGMSAPMLYINAEMCADAGLDINNLPETWEDVRVWSEAIQAHSGDYGVSIQNPSDTWSVIPLFLSSGIDSVIQDNGDGTYSAQLNTPEAVEGWTMLQDMVKDKLCVQLTMDEGVAAFVGGDVAMFLTSSGRASYFSSTCEFDVVAAGQPGFEGYDMAACIGGNVLSIVGEDEDLIKASWEFIKFLQQPENIGVWCESTGYLPPTIESVTDETVVAVIDNTPLMQVALDNFGSAAQWTSWPTKNGLDVDQYLVNMRDSIMSNMADPATTIKSAEDTINGLLAG